jgi:hypothetical protein
VGSRRGAAVVSRASSSRHPHGVSAVRGRALLRTFSRGVPAIRRRRRRASSEAGVVLKVAASNLCEGRVAGRRTAIVRLGSRGRAMAGI